MGSLIASLGSAAASAGSAMSAAGSAVSGALSSAGGAIASGAGAVGEAMASGAGAAGDAIASGAGAGWDALSAGFMEGSVLPGSPEAVKVAADKAAAATANATVPIEGMASKSAFATGADEFLQGAGNFAGEAWKGISSTYRGVGDDGMYKLSWGEALGSQLAEGVINYERPPSSYPGSAPLGTYGGGGGGGKFNVSEYLTRGY